MKESVTGIILTGGSSNRFGFPKAFAERSGKPFYQFPIKALRPFCKDILMVSHPSLLRRYRLRESNTHIMTDLEDYKGLGPLAGLYSGMEAHPSKWYMTAPIDTPFISAEIYRQLLSYLTANDEAVIPVVSGRRHPLIAIYHHSILKRLERRLATEERSVNGLLSECNVKEVPFEGMEHHFTNINTQADYEKYILQVEGECDDQNRGKREDSLRSHNRQ